ERRRHQGQHQFEGRTPLPSRLTPPRRPWSEGHGGWIAMAVFRGASKSTRGATTPAPKQLPPEPTGANSRQLWSVLGLYLERRAVIVRIVKRHVFQTSAIGHDRCAWKAQAKVVVERIDRRLVCGV